MTSYCAWLSLLVAPIKRLHILNYMFSFNERQSCKKGRSGTIYNFKSFFLTTFFSKNVLAFMAGCWPYQGDQLKEEHGHH